MLPPGLQEAAKLKLVETETHTFLLLAQFVTCLLPFGCPAWIPSCRYGAGRGLLGGTEATKGVQTHKKVKTNVYKEQLAVAYYF